MRASGGRRSGARVAGVALAVAIGAAVVPALPVGAAGVDCGTVVVEDVVLDADLTCPGTALVVGADGVTIDLGGHTLRGSGVGAGVVGNNGPDGRPGVTVRNGTIENFEWGITYYRFEDALFTGLTLAGNGFGIRGFRGARNVLRDSTVTGTRSIGVYGAEVEVGMELVGNRMSGNLIAIGFAFNSRDGRIAQNVMSGNGDAVSLIETNRFTIEENEITGNQRGLFLLLSDGHRVARNRITGQDGPGVALDGSGNSIERNVIDGNDVGVEVREGSSAEDTTVALNQVRGNRSAGMRVRSTVGSVEGTEVSGNVLLQNGWAAGGDGLEIALGATPETVVVARNRAFHNAGLGIDAPGVVDGGKNQAAQNGDPAQCVGVVC